MRVNCFLLLLLACHVTVTCSKREMLKMDMTADSKDVCRTEMVCKSLGSEAPVALSLQGPRGPPGKTGPPGGSGPMGMMGLAPRSVAFSVGLLQDRKSKEHSGSSDLIFDNVVTNIGDAYDKNTGRFTAPLNGTYLFTVTLAAKLKKKAIVDLVKKGRRVVTIWAENFRVWSPATNTVILTLVKEDQVWLMVRGDAPYIYTNMYSTFSGYALFPSTDDN